MSDFNITIEQAKSAILSRDYTFAEKQLLSQLKKIDEENSEQALAIKKLLGKLYIRSGNTDKGLTLYKELYALNPIDTEILNDLGVIYRKLGLLDKSIAVLLEARALDTTDSETLYNLGQTYKQNGDYENAVNYFSAVLEINPEDVLAYNHLGMLEFLYKDYNKAIEIYKTGLRIDPNHPILNFNIAEVFRIQDKYAEAMLSYQTALKARPNWTSALTGMADCHIKMGELQKAIEIYKNITENETKEGSEKYLTKLAELYELNGNENEAQNYYTEALKQNKDFPPALLHYSKMLKKQHKYFEAYELLSPNWEKNTTDKDLLIAAADLSLLLEKYPEAQQILQFFDNKWSEDFDVLKTKGKFFAAQGETQKAELIFEDLLKAYPEKIDIRLEIAELYAYLNKLAQAAKQLLKYLEKKPEDIPVRLELGKVYSKMGSFSEAKAEYEKIIKTDAHNIEAITAAAELNKDSGNTAETVRLVNRIMDIQADESFAATGDNLLNSLELYEEAVKAYENNPAVDRNLQKLAASAEENSDAIPQQTDTPALAEKEEENDNKAPQQQDELLPLKTEKKDDSLIFDDDDEEIPDLEMPFDDLIELAGEEDLKDETKGDGMEDLTSFDTPLDENPETEFEDDDSFLSENYGKQSRNAMQEDEFCLPEITESEKAAQNENKKDDKTGGLTLDEFYANQQPEPAIDREGSPSTAEAPLTAAALTEETTPPISGAPKLEGDGGEKAAALPASPLTGLMEELAGKIGGWLDEHSKADIAATAATAKEEKSGSFEKTGGQAAGLGGIYADTLPHTLKPSPAFENELELIMPDDLLNLFLYLKDLMDNLPPEESKDFLISNERIQMEYIINKLSGDVGLKNRIIFMNIKNTLKKTMEPKNITEKTLKDTLGYLRIIASQLPDKGFASSCIHKINNLITQLK